MCTTRSWKSLGTSLTGDVISARRSDNVIFLFYEVEFDSVSQFINRLEEFRNCDCSQGVPCNKHNEEKERLENVNSKRTISKNSNSSR